MKTHVTIPEPFDQSEDQFIRGTEQNLEVDDIFAKSLAQVIEDMRNFDPEALDPQGGKILPSLFEPGYSFQDVPCGVLLLDEKGEIAGGYLSYDLVLAERCRGKGLGVELVIERCLRDGENPQINLDEAAYSRKGLRAHRLAWVHARQNIEETRRRLSRWEGN